MTLHGPSAKKCGLSRLGALAEYLFPNHRGSINEAGWAHATVGPASGANDKRRYELRAFPFFQPPSITMARQAWIIE